MTEHAPTFDAAGLTDVGLKRKRNEDAFDYRIPAARSLEWQAGALFVVCDGIGGMGGGDVASQAAVAEILARYYAPGADEEPPLNRLKAALESASAKVRDLAASVNLPRIGATVAGMALIPGDEALLFNVGDSRVYRLRGSYIELLTRDQSVMAAQIESGLLSEEQAKAARNLNVTAYLGQPNTLSPYYHRVQTKPGDVFVACSDGLWDLVEPDEMLKIVRNRPAKAAARQLVQLARQRGAHDNVTVIVARIGPAPAGRRLLWAAAAVVVLAAVGIAAALVASGALGGAAPVASPGTLGTAALTEEAAPPTHAAGGLSLSTITPTPATVEAAEVAGTAQPTETGQALAIAVVPSATPRPSVTPTDTRTPTPTRTHALTRTPTVPPTLTPTPLPYDTPTATATPSPTPTATPTNTPTPVPATSTPVPSHTPPPTPTPTRTAQPTATDVPPPTVTLNPDLAVLVYTPTPIPPPSATPRPGTAPDLPSMGSYLLAWAAEEGVLLTADTAFVTQVEAGRPTVIVLLPARTQVQLIEPADSTVFFFGVALLRRVQVVGEPDDGAQGWMLQAALENALPLVPRVYVNGTAPVNVRAGDSVNYAPVGRLMPGQTARIRGLSSLGSGWFYVEIANGVDGWIAPPWALPELVVIGDTSNMRLFNPPTPTDTPEPSATPEAAATEEVKGTDEAAPPPEVTAEAVPVG